jgi:hypothetical protein
MSSFTDLPPDIEGDMPPDIEPLEEIATNTTDNNNNTAERSTPATTQKSKGTTTPLDEEPTMMEEMMAISNAEKAKRIAKRDALRKKQDKSFGSGLQGGFFNQSKKKKKKKKKKGIQSGFLNATETKPKKKTAAERAAAAAKKKKEEEDIVYDVHGNVVDDIIRPKMKKSDASTDDFKSSLRFDEVQAAMKATTDTQAQWMTPDFLQRVASNPKLAMAMSNPRCMQAMSDFQTDPAKAAEKYKNDKVVNSFMEEFMGLMGDHMHNLGAKQKHNQEINERAQKEEAMKKIRSEDPEVAQALANPEVFNLLNDPEMKAIMKECSEQQYALGKYMQDPKIRKKLMKMKELGLIQF